MGPQTAQKTQGGTGQKTHGGARTARDKHTRQTNTDTGRPNDRTPKVHKRAQRNTNTDQTPLSGERATRARHQEAPKAGTSKVPPARKRGPTSTPRQRPTAPLLKERLGHDGHRSTLK